MRQMDMNELVPYLVYILLAGVIIRTCAVFLARRAVEKTAGEEVLAKLPLLASRSIGDSQDTFYACILALQSGSARRPATCAALVYMCLLAAFVTVLLMMAVLGIIAIVQYESGT